MATEQIKFSDLSKFTDRQQEATRHLDSGATKFLLYGGALGGGKSYWLRWVCLRRLLNLARSGHQNAAVMLACEDYPSLKDRQLSKIGIEFPAWLGELKDDHKMYGRCFLLNPEYGGDVLCFRNLDDPSKYQSAEFAMIAVDELTKNNYDVFTFLRSRLRWKGLPDIECQFVAGTNPGGVGHGWVKQLWIDRLFGDEWRKPIDFTPQFAFVPSKADDNPHLDPAYWAMLQTLPENLRKAFRDGDWDIFVGQAFPEFRTETHVIEPHEIPESAPLYMTFDWGFGAPFSIGWWYVSNDGRLVRVAEWYGWSGAANQGLRLPDSEIAKGIVDREIALGIHGKSIARIAGHDCFSKRPDYKGGGQGPSTAEVFAEARLYLDKGDSTRELKIRAFRERLRIREDGLPRLLVFSTCEQFRRTFPNLTMDPNKIEDVDTKGEDHIYDEACHICMHRTDSNTGGFFAW